MLTQDQVDKIRQKYPDKDQAEVGYVYFIIGEQTGLVKIGWSMNYQARILDLQVGSPDRLRILKIIEITERPIMHNAKKLEARLHRRFKKYRVRGEWFQLSNSILYYLHKVNDKAM